MGYHYEIRLSGEGGQGIVLAGVILAEAAAIYDGKNATQTQVYGPESRGGASKAEVIISDEEIDYPKAISVDLLLALTQAAADKFSHDVKPSGILVLDSSKVQNVPQGDFTVHHLPIIDTAKETVGKAMVANIVSLGVIVGLSKVVSRHAIEEAVLARVPKGEFAVHLLPIIETAKETVGKAMVANIVSLGVIVGLSKVVSRRAIEAAVLDRVPKGTEELNRRALEAGFALAGAV